jgi:hypothetical protein
MKKILWIAGLIVFVGQLLAQNNGMIKGRIIDELGAPMPYANVVTEAYGQLVGSTTDFDGVFVLKPLPEGKYNVTISYIGYQNYTLKGVELSAGQVLMLNTIKMDINNTLPTIVVPGKRVIDSDQTINKMSLKGADIRNMPSDGSIAGLIRTMSSEVQVNEKNEIILRGSRPGNSITIVDGIKSMGEVSVTGSAIGSITVYSGGIPAKYGDFTGGVVLINTRDYFDYYYENLNN